MANSYFDYIKALFVHFQMNAFAIRNVDFDNCVHFKSTSDTLSWYCIA